MSRYRILTIGIEDLLNVFKIYDGGFDCLTLPVFDKLPDGYSVHDATYDFSRQAFLIKISHDSFEEVRVGDMIQCQPAIISFRTCMRDKHGKFSLPSE